MKFIRVFVALLILTGAVMAEGAGDHVVLGDFDSTFQGFSFSKGAVITVGPDFESLPNEIDFIVDLPNGLAMNNSVLSDWFSGETMILDLGDVPLEEGGDLPTGEFTPFLLPEEIISGHTYLVQTAEPGHYGMVRFVDFDSDKILLTFDWIYVIR